MRRLSILRSARLPFRAALLSAGAALVALAAAFLLVGRWDGAAPPSEAAGPALDSLETPTPDLGHALADVDAGSLFRGLLRLAPALEPTPTSTPEPTATALPPAPAPASSGAPQAVPTSPPAPPPAADRGCPAASMGGFGLALFDAINNERVQAGLPALAAHGCLVYIAQVRSNDMASRGYFSHTSPEGETAFSLLDAYGVPHGWAGENLARNNYPDSETVAVAIRDLMASDGHRANILNTNYTHLGVAAADDGAGMKYYTMIFIGPP